MSKGDLQARPIGHRKRDSIEARLTIVFAALAVSRWAEGAAGWSSGRRIQRLRKDHYLALTARIARGRGNGGGGARPWTGQQTLACGVPKRGIVG
jgi:hypothetical protein